MKTDNKQNEKFRFSEEMESFLKEQLKEGCSIAEVTITVKGLDFTATQKLTKKEYIDEWLKDIFRT
jgi:hypothetical protein